MGSITVGVDVSGAGNMEDMDSGVVADALTIAYSTDLNGSAKMEKEGSRTQTYGRRASVAAMRRVRSPVETLTPCSDMQICRRARLLARPRPSPPASKQ